MRLKFATQNNFHLFDVEVEEADPFDLLEEELLAALDEEPGDGDPWLLDPDFDE